MSKKRSPIWEYFKVAEDSHYAICNVTSCNENVSRGGQTTKTFNTSNLVYHLKSKHKELHEEYLKKLSDGRLAKDVRPASQSSSKQLTLPDMRKWDISDPRAQAIHFRIAEMIALDYQPFSLVDDVGFSRLIGALEPRYVMPSRRYITETIMPKLYENCKKGVEGQLKGVPHFSFTSDLWSTTVSVNSLMSLTAHWVTENFVRKRAILHAQSFEGSHTGEQIQRKLQKMLTQWGIQEHQVHMVLRDNGTNMVKALNNAGLPHYGCFAHTLQLVINDGVLSQRAVNDLLASCRRIVGHYSHSCLAYSRLREIQQNLGLPQHRLIQDEPTRWNSSLYMMNRILEQKMAIAVYATEKSVIQLTSHQLDLAAKVVAALSPIEEVTKSISADAAAISVIIPFVKLLSKTLNDHQDDRGIRTMKSEMDLSLKRRFEEIEDNEKLTVATLVDPRFKDKFFSGPAVVEKVKKLVRDLIKSVEESSHHSEEEPPAEKRPCPESGIWKTFSDILEEAGANVSDSSNLQELDTFLAEPLIKFGRESCYSWWASNHCRFPSLAKIARQYLSAPATSVASERLFSGAGDVYDEKRSRLTPENAEMLLFIKNNFDLRCH